MIPRHILHSVVLATFAQGVGRLVNLLLPWLVVLQFGFSGLTDTFFLALAIAFFFQGSLGNAVSDQACAHWSAFKRRLGRKDQYRGVVLISIVASGVAMVALDTSEMSAMILVATVGMSAAGIVCAHSTGLLHATGQYMAPGLSWLLRLLALPAIFLPLRPELALALVALAIFLSELVRAAWLSQRVSGSVSSLASAEPGFSDTHALRGAFGHAIVGATLAGVVPLIYRVAASAMEIGTVSVFELADRLYSAVALISMLGVMNVVGAWLGRNAARSDFGRVYRRLILWLVLWGGLWAGVGVSLGLALPFLLEYLSVGSERRSELQTVLCALSLGLPFAVPGGAAMRFLIVRGETLYNAQIAAGSLILHGAFAYLATDLRSIGVLAIGQVVVTSLSFVCIVIRSLHVAAER